MGFNVVKLAQRRLQKSIQTRLFVMLFLLGIVSLSTLVFTSISLGKAEIEAEVSQRNQEIATLVAGQVDNHLDNITSSLKLEVQALAGGWRNSIPILRFVQQAYNNGYEAIVMIDKDGISFASYRAKPGETTRGLPAPLTTVNQTPTDLSNDSTYLATRTNDDLYFSPISLMPGSNDPIITIGLPIKTQDNVFNGTLKIEVNLKRAFEPIKVISVGQTTWIKVIDEKGLVFAASNPTKVGLMLNQTQLAPSQNKQSSQTSYLDNGRTYLAGYAPTKSRTGWGVIVAEASEDAVVGINRLGMIAAAIAAILMIVTSVVGVMVSKSITKPVRELAIAANQITTTGNLDAQIPITSQDEVGELTASFNGMILGLRKTRMALEHWNRELEHKVEVRTQEQALINTKLEQTNLQLERANLHKSQFLANMSHELRTPLNAIIGFSEVLQDQGFGELNDRQARYVANILSSGRHLLNLVNDVLDLSKVEAGKMELHWEEFSCQSAIYEVHSQLSTLAEQKNLQLHVEIGDGLDRIMADRARYRQILFNLLSNAIKFTPQDGNITIRAGLKRGEKPECSWQAVFAIADTGIGISAENLEKVFESFRQLDNTYSRQYQGTGLGLALTRKLVEMHGGTIWLESQPGAGSTFSFSIPLISSLVTMNALVGVSLAEVGLKVAE